MNDNQKTNVDKLEDFYREASQIEPWLIELMIRILRKKKRTNQIAEEIVEETVVKTKEKFEQKLPTDFVKKIDEYINSFSCDSLLKKPDFFLDFKDTNITNYIKDSSNKSIIRVSENTDATILENRDISNATQKQIITVKDASGNDIETETDFNQNKHFYDINTEFITRNKIYTDGNQELIFRFQYLVNNFFNYAIDCYIKQNKLTENSIMFIYKGGTSMKMIFDKYSKLFQNNSKFLDLNRDFFKRSDSDYSIYIDKKFFKTKEIYTHHYYNMNIITYNVLKYINDFINKNIDELLPINKITDSDLKDLLNEHNKYLHENRLQRERKLLRFKDVKEFIGISIFDKTYMKEELPDKFVIKKLESTDKLLDADKNVKISGKFIDKDKYMRQHKKMPIEKSFFYITSKKDSTGKNEYYPVVCYPDVGDAYNSGLYQYYNETNRFLSYDNKNFNYFTLHRTKLNIVLYYKTFSDTPSYGAFSCPSELIDVPISLWEDSKSKPNALNIYKKYTNNTLGNTISFNSYTVDGFIDDLYISFFADNSFPWIDKKYEKKINRLMTLLLIYLNNNYSNITEIITTLTDFLNAFDKSKALVQNLKKHDGSSTTSDEIYKVFINNLYDLHDRVKTSTLENKAAEKSMIDKIKEELNNFNPEKINSGYQDEPEDLPYLNKYLKYKEKYLLLKNSTK